MSWLRRRPCWTILRQKFLMAEKNRIVLMKLIANLRGSRKGRGSHGKAQSRFANLQRLQGPKGRRHRSDPVQSIRSLSRSLCRRILQSTTRQELSQRSSSAHSLAVIRCMKAIKRSAVTSPSNIRVRAIAISARWRSGKVVSPCARLCASPSSSASSIKGTLTANRESKGNC